MGMAPIVRELLVLWEIMGWCDWHKLERKDNSYLKAECTGPIGRHSWGV